MSVLDKFRLDGQVALITGASRGIGRAIVEAFGEAGARLILSSTKADEAQLNTLRGRGVTVDHIAADLSLADAPPHVVARAIEIGGRLDILVNNAGIADHGDTETFSEERYRRLMAINLDAVFLSCRAALGTMRKQRAGVILNIGSISGMVSNVPQRQAVYNASKAAVHMFTRSLASDYAAEGIRVNALAPGYVTTDMTNGGLADPEWGPLWRGLTPMGRAGTAEEIAAAALFLCSPAASYVTGETLVIDGGYTAR